VSIRPNVSSSAQPGLQLQPSGRIIWTATALKGLIGLAYQRYAFDRREVIGGPEWMDRDRFDILAAGERAAARGSRAAEIGDQARGSSPRRSHPVQRC
jgi:uncharacterized protein (TIGR03435 family)